jgi:hypothetical protein
MDHHPTTIGEKPVIVFQKGENENRRSSVISQQQQPKQGILSKPVSTASTWLGKRVRQQQKQDQNERNERNALQHQQFSVDSAALEEPRRLQKPHQLMTAASFEANSSVARTAYLPPPRIQSQSSRVS